MINTPETIGEESGAEDVEPDIRRLTVVMPRSMYDDLRAEATDSRELIGEYVRNILREHLLALEEESAPKKRRKRSKGIVFG